MGRSADRKPDAPGSSFTPPHISEEHLLCVPAVSKTDVVQALTEAGDDKLIVSSVEERGGVGGRLYHIEQLLHVP